MTITKQQLIDKYNEVYAADNGVNKTFNQLTKDEKVEALLQFISGGDASDANQTTVQANAGSDATKAIAIQGITGGKAVPVTGTFWQTTQPISAANLPLPTNAATSALQATGNTSLASIDGKTPALGQALAAASTPVVLPAAQITALTPPTTVGVNSLPALSTGSNAIGSITNTSFGISGTLPAFTNTPTFNIGTAPTIAVTGAFYPATQPVSLSTNTPTLQASSAIVGKVGIDQTTPGTTNKVSIGNDGTVAISGNVAVTGNFYQATQPISVASLPLPTQASTSALQTTGNTSLATIATNTGNIPANLTVSSTRLLVDNSGVTQPVSGTITANLGTIAGVATATNQETINTSLASINSKIPALGQALAASSTPVVLTASQLSTLTPLASVGITGTLPAFAATPTFNIGTAPSLTFTNTSFTANAGNNLNTSALALESGGNLAGINTKLPSNLTVSASRLLVDGSGVTQPVSMAAAPAGLAYESTATITRAADTTAYTANDVYGTVFELTNIGASGGYIFLNSLDIIFNITALPSDMGAFAVYLYSSTPPSAIADNLPYSLNSGDRASIIILNGFNLNATLARGGGSVVAEALNINQLFKLATGSTSLWGYLVTLNAFTPAANSETATIRARSFAP